jgi:hypothetical protein
MSKPTTVRFRDDEARELERIAQRQGTTVSDLVQRAVRAHYLRKDRSNVVRNLLAYVRKNSVPVEDSVDAIERRIASTMKHAARR